MNRRTEQPGTSRMPAAAAGGVDERSGSAPDLLAANHVLSHDAEAEARTLVERLEHNETRWPSWKRLEELGSAAAPAVRAGLRHGHWQVRKWCAAFLDHHADPDSLPELLPLLHDRKSDVRLWAVHSLSCDRCKVDQSPIDFVPLLIERVERDESIRVRRMAMVMLATTTRPDRRLAPLFARVLATESDAKMRKHAEWGLKRCREVGLAP